MTFQITKFTPVTTIALSAIVCVNKITISPSKILSAKSRLAKYPILIISTTSISRINILAQTRLSKYSANPSITRWDLQIFRNYFSQAGTIYSLSKFPVFISRTYTTVAFITTNPIEKGFNFQPKGTVEIQTFEGFVKKARPIKGQIFPRRRC